MEDSHESGMRPVWFMRVKRLAKEPDHQKGLLAKISLIIVSGPGAFPSFRVAISETTSSGETGGHSGKLGIIRGSERSEVEKILIK